MSEPTGPTWAVSERTYQPDDKGCVRGHSFTTEADCVQPEGWDNFMCRRCLICPSCSSRPGQAYACADKWHNGEYVQSQRSDRR